MKRTLVLTAILAVALAVTGYAQKKDFSGTWTLDQAATDAAATTTAPPATAPPATAPPATAPPATAPPAGGGGGGGRGGGGTGPMTIKQTADSLAIERAGRGGTPTTTTYKLDGTEQEVTMGQGTAKVKAKWDGDKIVIETTRAGQDGTPMTTTATYALDDKGMLWVETKNPQSTTKRAYKKTT